MQEDHLHSANTYFYPISALTYETFDGFFIPSVVIFLVLLVKIIG